MNYFKSACEKADDKMFNDCVNIYIYIYIYIYILKITKIKAV